MGATDNGNSWESTANDQAFREQAGGREATQPPPRTSGEPSSPPAVVRWDIDDGGGRTTTDTRNNNNSNNSNAAANGRTRRKFSMSGCSWSYFLHVFDIVVTCFWTAIVGYHLYFNKNNERHSRSTEMALLLILCIVLAVSNLLRGVLWIWASLPSLSTICGCCGSCCFGDNDDGDEVASSSSRLSIQLTLWLALVYGSVSVVAWFGPDSWLPWCDGFGKACSEVLHTQMVVAVAVTAASVIELLRWIFLQGRLASTAATRTARSSSPEYHYYNDDEFNNDGRNQPWWIRRRPSHHHASNNEGMNDPLLGSSPSPASRGGFWSPSWTTPFWSPSRSSGLSHPTMATASAAAGGGDTTDTSGIRGDEEDVESVLDSLGENWASRAESDPYWWTR